MTILEKYARLLVRYCLNVQPGDQVLISTTLLAEPLLREVYREALAAGAGRVECDLSFRDRERIFLDHASDETLRQPGLLTNTAFQDFDCYLSIRAPYNLRDLRNAPAGRQKMRSEALAPMWKTYFDRTASRALRRNLCQYPTEAAAQEAGMSLTEYEQFVYGACKLNADDPIASWLELRARQQGIVDHLNSCKTFRYVADGTDLTFSAEGRVWINSDGQTNMPSGEVYTSPVEDSVNGTVYFSFPSMHQGANVEGVRLWVKDGLIERWEARRGQETLDQLFHNVPGARRFGEAAIGTNYDIRQQTNNILFDEKIGGTVHLAIGQSYAQAGGKNESAVHWDLITDMTNGGEIWADGEQIYANGAFIQAFAAI